MNQKKPNSNTKPQDPDRFSAKQRESERFAAKPQDSESFAAKPQLPRPKKLMTVAYLLLLALVVGVFVGLRSCSAPGVVLEAEKSGASGGDTIDVAMLYAPMNYYSYADTLGGYSYDLLRLIAAREGLALRFWPVNSLAEAQNKLTAGDYDLLASLPETAAFKNRVLYTDSVYIDRQVLVAMPETKFGSVFDLDGATVHIEDDSPLEPRIHNMADESGITINVKRHPELSSELLVVKVAQREFSFAVVNELVAEGMLRSYPNLVITPVGFSQKQDWAVAPGDSVLLRRMNVLLKKYTATPEGEELRRRYFAR